MKKFIIALFSFILVFAAHNASASTLWNGASNDCQSIAVANQTTGLGYGTTPCWTASSVSANVGETVSVRVYYHNSSDLFGISQTATNVRIAITAPTTPTSNPSFTGQIISDQGNVSFGPVSASLLPSNTTQTLTLSSVRWYPNQSQTPQAFQNGQSGNEVLSSGLTIGSVAPGYGTQGSVVVNFLVTTPGVPNANQDCTIVNYNASPTYISSGQSTTLSWDTVGCSTLIISGIGQVSSPSGSTTVTPTSNTTYTLRAYGTQGNNPTIATRDITVNIGAILASICFDRGAINFGGFAPCQYPILTPICPDRGALNYGGSLPCQYPITIQTCNDTNAVNYGGVLPCVYPTLQNCVINNFGASATSVNIGQSTVLSWGTGNCTTVSVAGPNMSNYSQNGSQILYPTTSGSYTITASGPNNQAPAQSVYVTVVNNNYSYPSYDSYNSYNSYNTYGCTVNNFTANPNYTSFSSAVTLSWSTNNCTSANVSGSGIYNTSLNGSQTIYPSNSGTYTITAYSPNTGNVTRTVYVTVTGANNQAPQQPYAINACAVTTVATNLTKTSAQLNGTLSGSGYASTNTYFEYGTTVALGQRTAGTFAYGNGTFNNTISGLDPDTVYYYRAVADCANGTSRGSIEVFSTLAPAVTHVVVAGTTVVGTQSPVQLSITNKYQQIGVGDIVDYTVIYKNIGKSTLAQPLLQVVVPKGITLINASAGIYEAGSNTQNIQLQDIAPKEEGAVYLQGRVNVLTEGSLQVATTAILIYTNATGAQENVMAYVLNQSRMMLVPAAGTVSDNSIGLGAAAFFGAFFDLGLIGWLIVIILILFIILMLRKYYYKPTPHIVPMPPYTTTTTTTHH